MTNVNGNWKKRKPIQRNLSLKKIPGQGVKTHDVMKGISFKDKAYKWGASTRAGAQKVYGKIGRSYKKYGKPTETLFRKTGAGVLGVGKFAIKRGALGFPGLAATGLYLAAQTPAPVFLNKVSVGLPYFL
jgi:hypothetical protein